MNQKYESYYIKEIQDSVRTAVQGGFDEPEEILEETIFEFEDEDIEPEWLENKARTIINAMFLAHYLKQSEWKHDTDCDKLDDAFAELDRHGILARHNWHAINHDEMRFLMNQENHNKWIIGYVFYSWQDTENVVENDRLYLSYGSFDQTESEDREVAKIIVDVLKKHGLPAQWSGNSRQRIWIEMKWQRRRLPFQLEIS